MKKCSKCALVKNLLEFSKDSRKRDGRQSRCKQCRGQIYRDNKDRYAESRDRWRKANPDRVREAFRSWSDRNRGHKNEYLREWRSNNPDRVRSHEVNRRVRKRGTLTTWDLDTSAERRKAIFNDPCFYCGTTEGVFHVDHYFPIAKGGDDRWSNLVRACESCNLSKGARCGTAFKLRKQIV